MDEAFEKYRKEHFGAYVAYPIDAYRYFCAGWRAGADAMYKAERQATEQEAAQSAE